MSNPPPVTVPGGALRRLLSSSKGRPPDPCRPCPEFPDPERPEPDEGRRVIEGSSQGASPNPDPSTPLRIKDKFIEGPPRPAAGRGRLSIGFQMTGDQLQVTIEVACHTDRMQVLTTIGWADCIDAFSRRLLTDTLRTAAQPGNPACLHVFAATARDLFRHSAKTLPPHPAGHGLADPFSADANALHGDLLAATCALRNACRLRPRLTITDRAEAGRCVAQALSALHGLYASFGSYLEHALQPLEPHVTRQAVRAFVLETRAELDELAACHTVGNVYAESLTITEPGDNTINLALEASLGAVEP